MKFSFRLDVLRQTVPTAGSHPPNGTGLRRPFHRIPERGISRYSPSTRSFSTRSTFHTPLPGRLSPPRRIAARNRTRRPATIYHSERNEPMSHAATPLPCGNRGISHLTTQSIGATNGTGCRTAVHTPAVIPNTTPRNLSGSPTVVRPQRPLSIRYHHPKRHAPFLRRHTKPRSISRNDRARPTISQSAFLVRFHRSIRQGAKQLSSTCTYPSAPIRPDGSHPRRISPTPNGFPQHTLRTVSAGQLHKWKPVPCIHYRLSDSSSRVHRSDRP